MSPRSDPPPPEAMPSKLLAKSPSEQAIIIAVAASAGWERTEANAERILADARMMGDLKDGPPPKQKPTAREQMTYPKPDRSNLVPNLSKTEENEDIDIGWAEGTLSDGRPYRVELWAVDQSTHLTVFLSTIGLESYSSAQFVELLERERVVWWLPGAEKSAPAAVTSDASGNPIWSINIFVGADGERALVDSVPVRPY